MTLIELRTRTRRYVRDIASKRFTEAEIDLYLNEAVDRIRSYPAFYSMPGLDVATPISFLPPQYHYILALFAASRCFGVDNDFYQEQDKRNEFESAFLELIIKIESGDITIYDDGATQEEVVIEYPVDYVSDEYFGGSSSTEKEEII